LAALGLGVLVVLPFTPTMAHTPANDFVEALIRHLHLAELWGGADFALGHRREGNVSLLKRLGEERGFRMRVVEPVMWAGTPVSSSRIRIALEAGDIDQATACLGRPYRLTGAVVQGRGVGRRLEVPTTNLSPQSERLIPAGGVYACLAHTEHLGTHPAVVNIGTRPTFAQENLSSLAAPISGESPRGRDSKPIHPVPGQTMTVEAHLLNFDADVYGQTLSLDFVARLRDERPFPTPDALVTQIQKDIAQARDRLGVVSATKRKS
jgi:riboflavin kinase/FMN adenylyltransferase